MPQSGNTPRRIIVLGAGPAGIAAAFFAQERGYSVTLVEKNSFVGGKGASLSRGGYIVDFGPHAYHPKTPEINHLIESHAGDDYILTSVNMELILRNKRLSYPFKPIEGFLKFNPLFSLRIILDYLWIKAQNLWSELPEDSFRSWGIKHFGKTLYDLCFGDYTERVWGVPAEDLSVELAKRKLPHFSLWGLLTEALTKKEKMHAHIFTNSLGYHRRGIGAVYENIVKDFVSRVGTLVLDANIESIKVDHEGIARSVKFRNREPIACDYVISTVPLTFLVEHIEPRPALVDSLKGKVSFRDILLVNVFMNREQFSRAHWTYLVDNRFHFNRISEQKNLSTECCPPGKTMLTMEVSCPRGSDMGDWPPERFLPLILEDLQMFGITRADITEVSVSRLRDAYPIYYRDYEKELATILGELAKVKNLVSTGRQGLYLDIDMHDAMVLGRGSIDYILEGRVEEFYRAYEGLIRKKNRQ